MSKKNIKLKEEFIKYLWEKWWNVEYFKHATDIYSLDIFNIFLNWVKYKKERSESSRKIFYNYVSKVLKEKKNRIWMKNNTYRNLENLFIYFVEFCEENKEFFNSFLLEKYWLKFENYLSWDIKELIKNRHNCIINDNWENWEKFRDYLLDIYNKIGINNYDKLIKFYICFFQAYRKFSDINTKNKKLEKWKKQDTFDIWFKYLCEELSKFWILLEEWKIKSLFWKYLNFIPEYRDKIWLALRSDLVKKLNGLKRRITWDLWETLEWDLVKKWSIPWNLWIEWDWFWPIEVLYSDEYWVYTARWDVLPPDYWIYPKTEISWEWENTLNEEKQEEQKNKGGKKSKKHKKKKKNNGQTEIDFS